MRRLLLAFALAALILFAAYTLGCREVSFNLYGM